MHSFWKLEADMLQDGIVICFTFPAITTQGKTVNIN